MQDLKFWLHLVGAASIVTLISVGEFLLRGSSHLQFTISAWLLGLSLCFWGNQQDIRINSFIVSAFLPLIFIEGIILATGIWYDLLHLPTIGVIFYILWKNRTYLNFRYILYSVGGMTAWTIIVVTTSLAYTYEIYFTFEGVTFSFSLLYAFPLVMVANLLVLYWLLRKATPGTIISFQK